jgi:hypothetical protein
VGINHDFTLHWRQQNLEQCTKYKTRVIIIFCIIPDISFKTTWKQNTISITFSNNAFSQNVKMPLVHGLQHPLHTAPIHSIPHSRLLMAL